MQLLAAAILTAAIYMSLTLVVKVIKGVQLRRSFDATPEAIITCVLWGTFYFLASW